MRRYSRFRLHCPQVRPSAAPRVSIAGIVLPQSGEFRQDSMKSMVFRHCVKQTTLSPIKSAWARICSSNTIFPPSRISLKSSSPVLSCTGFHHFSFSRSLLFRSSDAPAATCLDEAKVAAAPVGASSSVRSSSISMMPSSTFFSGAAAISPTVETLDDALLFIGVRSLVLSFVAEPSADVCSEGVGALEGSRESSVGDIDRPLFLSSLPEISSVAG